MDVSEFFPLVLVHPSVLGCSLPHIVLVPLCTAPVTHDDLFLYRMSYGNRTHLASGTPVAVELDVSWQVDREVEDVSPAASKRHPHILDTFSGEAQARVAVVALDDAGITLVDTP